jgi:galactoside O-acetyltransferase
MGILHRLKIFCFVTLRVRKYKLLSDCLRVTGRKNIRLYHPLLLSGPGKISIGDDFQSGVIRSTNYYSHYNYLQVRNPDSEIIIGNNVAFNNGISLIADTKITIGDFVLVGAGCYFVDNDAHDLDPALRITGTPKAAPIVLKENVLLNANVIILKGVTIGKNSVIGSGSVVTKDIPDNVLAAGIPARVIRTL